MIKNETVGIGIITYNRPKSLENLIVSLENCISILDYIIVINDGNSIDHDFFKTGVWVDNEKNIGVGRSKNKALRYLLDQKCDHLFLLEDDIVVKDKNIFSAYIKASKASGIQHFNHALRKNYCLSKSNLGENIRCVADYDTCKISLHSDGYGCFSYFTKYSLETVGLLDEQFYNAYEHFEHTYQIIQAGLHPPFWYFADIEDAARYIEIEPWTATQSTLISQEGYKKIRTDASTLFCQKYGFGLYDIPLETKETVIQQLKKIKEKFSAPL